MSRERVISLTFIALGVAMVLGGALWLWLGYRGSRGNPWSEFSPVWPMGTLFIGLLVAAGGASTYRSD